MEKNYRKLSFIYFISLISVSVLFLLGYLGIFTNDFLATFLIQCIVMLATPLSLYTLFVSKSIKKTFKDTGFRKISTKMLILTLALGVVLYILNTFIADFFAGVISLLGYENIGTSEPIQFDYTLLLKELFLSALLPGICEEVLHRGILLHAGKKYQSTRFCLIISSILFGLTHLNINQFFYAAILGLLIGHVSLMAGSIYPAMILHFMNNALSTYFYYGVQLNWPFATKVNQLLSLLLNNIAIFFLVILLSICVLVLIYIFLSKRMFIERRKYEVAKVIKKMRKGQLTLDDAIEKVNRINKLFNLPLKKAKRAKSSFTTNIFIICSIILGAIITISTFIWGIL